MRIVLRVAAALAAVIAASACGGGGGGGGGNDGGEPPVALAGPDGNARLFRSYLLAGGLSNDPEGEDLTFTWTVLSSPEPVSLSNAETATPSFTPGTPGTYLFGLSVSDGKNESTLDTVEIEAKLRVAVAGDSYELGPIAERLRSLGIDAADWTADPHSTVVGATGTWIVTVDRRNNDRTIMAFESATSNTFAVATGDIDQDSIFVDGDFIVWTELRDGQVDIVSHRLSSGVTTQVTDSVYEEELTSLKDGIAVWHETEDPLNGGNVFARNVAGGGVIAVAATPAFEVFGRTDGDTIVYSREGEIFSYDVATYVTVSLDTSGSSFVARAVSGPYAVYSSFNDIYVWDSVLGSSLQMSFPGEVIEAEGDYLLYRDDGGGLNAYRFSTATNTVVSASSFGISDVADGVVAYENGAGRIFTRVLPAGAPTEITAAPEAITGIARGEFGVGWSAARERGEEAFYGSTLISTGKIYLDENLDDYDAILFAGYGVNDYLRDVVDAADAAGVPMLGTSVYAYGLAEYLQDSGQYGLEILQGFDCARIHVLASSHPVFETFAPGLVEMERLVVSIDNNDDTAEFFTTTGPGTVPSGYTVLAEYPDLGCGLDVQPAIVQFSTALGTPVILDGTSNDSYGYVFWSDDRWKLIAAELHWLAEEAAP